MNRGKRHNVAVDGINPNDFRTPIGLYFPYTEEEKVKQYLPPPVSLCRQDLNACRTGQ